jgi:hypothetical protein
VARLADELGVSEAAALKRFDDPLLVELAVNTAHGWRAWHVAEEVEGTFWSRCPRRMQVNW